ncbi:MAG: HAMP domain-containing sensor histidine kinase [Kofleriaceae bacterium]|nr:HAMP domain-containing sensor histidine kinase [Kofleriaceae bacterium]
MRPDLVPGGTNLASPPRVPADFVGRPTAASCNAMWRDHRNQVFVAEVRETSRLTIGLGCLVQLATLGILVLADFPLWRVIAMASLYVAFAVLHRIIVRPMSDSGRVEAAVISISVIAQVFVVSSTALSGGIHSPLAPGLVLPSIVSLLFFGPYPVARWTALGNGLLIVAMVCLPQSIVGNQLPPAHYTAAMLINLGWNMFMLHLLVAKLTKMSTTAGDSVDHLREERIVEAIAQLRRLQSVGAKVAHELKNPLASIKGLCQLVARTPESERTQERLAVVASEISRMETILAEYLSFSRPLEDLKPETLNLSALARDVIGIIAGRADQAGVTLELDGPETSVQGDPRRLKEALINLVSNAVEATPNGGRVQLRVRADASHVTLEVKDTGRGISSEDLERLGTSFFTTRPNGTGLGVVLAQTVITQHGGSLAYQSALGQGTTATIQLPTLMAAKATTLAEPAPRAAMIEARA